MDQETVADLHRIAHALSEIVAEIDKPTCTSLRFRPRFGELTTLVRDAANTSGLVAALDRQLSSIVDEQVRAHQRQHQREQRQERPQQQKKFRWSIVVEELKIAKRRREKMMMQMQSSSRGDAAGGFATSTNQQPQQQQQQQQQQPFSVATERTVGTILGPHAETPVDAPMLRAVEASFAIVHFLVDPQSIADQVSAAASLSLFSPSQRAQGRIRQRDDDASVAGDDETTANVATDNACLEDAMSILWRGKPLLKTAPREEDGDGNDVDDARIKHNKNDVVVSGASTRQVLASADWMQFDCAMLMKNGELVLDPQITKLFCPVGVVASMTAHEFAQRELFAKFERKLHDEREFACDGAAEVHASTTTQLQQNDDDDDDEPQPASPTTHEQQQRGGEPSPAPAFPVTAPPPMTGLGADAEGRRHEELASEPAIPIRMIGGKCAEAVLQMLRKL